MSSSGAIGDSRIAPDGNANIDWWVIQVVMVKVDSHAAQCPSVIAPYALLAVMNIELGTPLKR